MVTKAKMYFVAEHHEKDFCVLGLGVWYEILTNWGQAHLSSNPASTVCRERENVHTIYSLHP